MTVYSASLEGDTSYSLYLLNMLFCKISEGLSPLSIKKGNHPLAVVYLLFSTYTKIYE